MQPPFDEAAHLASLTGMPYDVAARINAGVDILMDNGVILEDAVFLMVAAEKQGRNAEHAARELMRRVNEEWDAQKEQ